MPDTIWTSSAYTDEDSPRRLQVL